MRQHHKQVALSFLTAISVVTVALIGAPAAFAGGAETNNLQQNEQLDPGQRLINNGIALVMQNDGNLVEYAAGNRVVWASNTNRSGSIVRMQGDGNLVIIAPGGAAVWATGTNGNPGAGLELQTDGNAVVYAQGHVAKWANGVNIAGGSARDLANAILNNGNIALQTVHVSGVRDNANTRQNIVDTANGGQAARSAYQGAPGGTVALDTRMLSALKQIGSEGALRVSEIAGGSHTADSKHYGGRAFDVDQYGGRSTATITSRCAQLGASYTAYENENHVHCEW